MQVVVVGDGDTTASFMNCSFLSNTIANDAAWGGSPAVINAIEWTDPEYTQEDDSKVLVRTTCCGNVSAQTRFVIRKKSRNV